MIFHKKTQNQIKLNQWPDLAVVLAITAGEEAVVQVDVDVLLGEPLGAVLDVLGVVVVQGVDARHRDALFAVGHVGNLQPQARSRH